MSYETRVNIKIRRYRCRQYTEGDKNKCLDIYVDSMAIRNRNSVWKPKGNKGMNTLKCSDIEIGGYTRYNQQCFSNHDAIITIELRINTKE